MNAFYNLEVIEVRRETEDCVSIAMKPQALDEAKFQFQAGQYLTLKANIGGEEVRRSYSICSAPVDGELRVAVKRVENGLFSNWANETLKAGDVVDSMTPRGNFVLETAADAKNQYAAFAAGSGITPIMSQIRSVLLSEAGSQFTLFYVNKDTASIIFREQLQELKDEFMERFRVFHLLTREPLEAELFHGRLDEDRCSRILSSNLIDIQRCSGVYLCGPEAMIWACKASLEAAGVSEEAIHFELFTTAASAERAVAKEVVAPSAEDVKSLAIVLDGITTMVEIKGEKTIMDAALDIGLDAPYSCLGGVCCTCRAKMTKGRVRMDVNYALDASETDAGFVLACQSHLEGEGPFEVDFDQQ
ncbi:MAG: 2Fe-2S iron-sulfur cluster-binding protein [Bacteroidetes bacterium]|jgi:ring-1,2-phenylacetyl-CoA epoxidase subunit PaaE|nr:2Fe-2S iron-sulfur cluster-binding protein [Bacteroidota bacterium]